MGSSHTAKDGTELGAARGIFRGLALSAVVWFTLAGIFILATCVL